MAGEYYRWLARNVTPEEKRELTPEEKRRNWWDYHKFHLLGGIVLAVLLGFTLADMLNIGETLPDYGIAYVGTLPLSEEAAEAVTDVFTACGRDENGDGTVTVALYQYVSYSTADYESYYDSQTAITQLVADIALCDSYFFLLDDPEQFQAKYGILCALDGSLPEASDTGAQGKYLLLADCPAFSGLSLPEGLALARRGFWTESTVAHLEGCQLLWEQVTDTEPRTP